MERVTVFHSSSFSNFNGLAYDQVTGPERREIARFWHNPVQFLESSLPKMVGGEGELC
jgi:hypothetical protein